MRQSGQETAPGLPHSQRRKRLLFISVNNPNLPLTGSSHRTGHFVRHLARRFDLDVTYLDGAGHAPGPELAELANAQIPGVDRRVHVPFRQFDYFLFSRRMYAQAANMLRTRPYDAIVCDYGTAAAYGVFLSARFHVPFIYCSHNIEYQMYRDRARADGRRWVLLPYMYGVERLGVQRCKLLVPITEEDATHYARWTSPQKMFVVPQGFDAALFNPFYSPSVNGRKVILYCGNYNNQFNRDVVKVVVDRIMPEVLAAFPDVIFRFVGPNPPSDVSHPNVEFTGFVDEAGNAAHLKQADVVISARQQQRGFPTKTIEALACGKPLIATAKGAWAIGRDYQTLHLAELDQFAARICFILTRNQPVSTADFEKLKSRFSWDANLQRLADRIEAVI